MHVPGLTARLKDAATLLEAFQLAESEPDELVRLAAAKVAEVNRSLETYLSTLAKNRGEEVPCRKR